MYDGNDSLVMRFEYADGRMPVAMTTNDDSVYYLGYDQVGSLRTVTDISGAVVRRSDYDSFGNIYRETNSAFEVPFGFAGGLYDRDTRLVRFGFRDYDPDVGMWTAKDPILFAGGDTDLYGYCINDPVNHIDPEGKLLFTLTFGFTAWAFAGDVALIGSALYVMSNTMNEENVIRFPKPYKGPKPAPPPPNKGPVNPRRFEQCSEALTRCSDQLSNCSDRQKLCYPAYKQCILTDIPVLFPNGEIVY